MAVDALLITPQSQVDLQNFHPQAMQSVTLRLGNLFFKIVHRSSPVSTPQLHKFRRQVGFRILNVVQIPIVIEIFYGSFFFLQKFSISISPSFIQ